MTKELAPEGFDHTAKREDYEAERREYTAKHYIETKKKEAPKAEPNVEGETPIMEREMVARFNGA